METDLILIGFRSKTCSESAQICSDLLRIGVSDQNLLRKFGPISAICSVAVALAGVFAILINKIRKIMEIFE